MTGFQLTAWVNRSAELVPQPCGPPSFSNSSRLRNWRWRTSAPLQNARPLPFRIATSASGSRSKRRNASASWRTTSSLTALSLSGRFSVMVATWSAQAYSTKFCSSVSTTPSREPPDGSCRNLGGSLRGEAGGCQRRPAGRSTHPAIRFDFGSDHVKHVKQNDHRDRDPDQPEKNAAHVRSVRLLRVCRYKRMRQGLVLSDDFLRRVFDVADRAADLALAFIDLALGLEIAVTGHLPGLFLDRSGCLFQAAFHPLFIHYLTSKHFSACK